jgi:hypothetical protein
VGDAVSAAASPSPDNLLRQRVADLGRAEQIQREAQAQIASNMDVRGVNDEPPKMQLSQRDLEWLGRRPGIERDPEFLRMASFTPGYGTDRFYQILDAAFPVENWRRQEPPPQPQPEPQLATEPRRHEYTDAEIIAEAKRIQAEQNHNAKLYSAPPSREIPSPASGQRQRFVQLTAEERQMARSLGLSEAEWARQKLRVAEEKRLGLHQDG